MYFFFPMFLCVSLPLYFLGLSHRFTAEWPSSLREVGNAISGMMGGNIVEFVSPACIGIGGTFYSRFGLTVGVMSGVIACIWLKAMCTIWKDNRKKKKEKAGGQSDAEQLSTFSTRNPMANTSDDDDNSTSSSSAPPPLDPARMANIMAAGQDTIIIISTCS